MLAWLIDVALAVRRAGVRLRTVAWRRLLAAPEGPAAPGLLGTAWRVLPGDLLGRLIGASSGAGALVRRVPVLRTDGGSMCDALVFEDRRLARYLDAMPVRPTAQTLGRYVVARCPLPEPTLRHELEHVRQWARLGPAFLPAYIASSGLAWLRGEDAYRANRFEVAARAEEQPGAG